MVKYVKTEQGYKEYKEVEAANSNKMDANNPVGEGSFSMGRRLGSVIGNCSHAEGNNTTASHTCSHAEGLSTTASGYGSHAEGSNTTAMDTGSHAEGFSTTASGYGSHAEGDSTTASGNHSHAEGEHCEAQGQNQHVQGKYNIKSGNKTSIADSDYAHIVGNGKNETTRSNAYTLTWSGIPWYQGRPQFGGTAMDNGSQTVMANGDKEIILASSTAGSTKKFKITVNDSGTISVKEVMT